MKTETVKSAADLLGATARQSSMSRGYKETGMGHAQGEKDDVYQPDADTFPNTPLRISRNRKYAHR